MTTMHLADFGADVIKVERPGQGDDLRRWGHMQDGLSLAFKVLNRNKRLVALDLSDIAGQHLARRLVERVDIVVESFRPGTLERWGLGFEDLIKVNPRLVMARITGFGQGGPYAGRRAFGTLAEAMSGMAHMNGDSTGRPRLPAFGLGDAGTAIFAAYGILMALFEQRVNRGPGQFIDVALYESLFTFLGMRFTDFVQVGAHVEGGRDSSVAPRNTYRTLDGVWLALSGGTQSTFESICHAVDRPDIVRDSRFVDNTCRIQHVDELDRALSEAVGALRWSDIAEKAEKLGAPIFPVYDIPMFLSDPHVLFRGNTVMVEDDDLGEVLVQVPAVRLSRTPGEVRRLAGPIGSDNEDVYREWLGIGGDEYGELRRKGVI